MVLFISFVECKLPRLKQQVLAKKSLLIKLPVAPTLSNRLMTSFGVINDII